MAVFSSTIKTSGGTSNEARKPFDICQKYSICFYSMEAHGERLPHTAKILLVDDYAPWRRVVACFLQENPEWHIVGELSDGLEAIQQAEELQPDLIVLDIGLPKLDGIEAARVIVQVAPHSKILFFSASASAEIAAEALRAGGHGYVVKSDSAELILAAKALLQGNRYISSSFEGNVFDD